MLKKEEIEQFYKDVLEVDLKFPVAAIAQATGHSKANVSKYLSRKLEPSEAFLRVFYEKFPKNGKIVSRETHTKAQHAPDYRDRVIALLEEKVNLGEKKLLLVLQTNNALLKTILQTLGKIQAKVDKRKVEEILLELNNITESHLRDAKISGS